MIIYASQTLHSKIKERDAARTLGCIIQISFLFIRLRLVKISTTLYIVQVIKKTTTIFQDSLFHIVSNGASENIL